MALRLAFRFLTLAVRFLTLAVLMATPAGLALGLADARRAVALRSTGTALEILVARYDATLFFCLLALLAFLVLGWLCERARVAEATGRSRTSIACRVATLVLAFLLYRRALACLVDIDALGPGVAPIDIFVLFFSVAWIERGPRWSWRALLDSPLLRTLHGGGLALLILLIGSNLAAELRAMAVAVRGSPDLVFIVAHGFRADQLGPGTPNLARLARSGIQFRHAIAPSSFPDASLCSLLSSRHPAEFGFGSVGRPEHLDDDALYLSEILMLAGYETHAIVSHPDTPRLPGLRAAFEHFDAGLAERDERAPTASEVTDRTLMALNRRHRRPYFVLVEYSDGRLPIATSTRLRNETGYAGPLSSEDSLTALRLLGNHVTTSDRDYLRRAHDERVSSVDREIGRLLEGLAASGADASTWLIMTSPSGTARFERGPESVGDGHALFDELIQVPLIVRIPGRLSGIQVAHAVGLVDLVPTLVAKLGLPTPPQHRSIGRVLDLERSMDLDRTPPAPIVSETRFGARRLQAVRFGSWKYIRDLYSQRSWLFDLDEDAGETRNRAAFNPKLVSRMERFLNEWTGQVPGESTWAVSSANGTSAQP